MELYKVTWKETYECEGYAKAKSPKEVMDKFFDEEIESKMIDPVSREVKKIERCSPEESQCPVERCPYCNSLNVLRQASIMVNPNTSPPVVLSDLLWEDYAKCKNCGNEYWRKA